MIDSWNSFGLLSLFFEFKLWRIFLLILFFEFNHHQSRSQHSVNKLVQKNIQFRFFFVIFNYFRFFHFKWFFICFERFFHGFSFFVISNFDKNVIPAKTVTNSNISNSDFFNSKIQDLKTISNFAVSGFVQKISRKYSTNDSVRQCSDFWTVQFWLHLFDVFHGAQCRMETECSNRMTKDRLKIFTHFAPARRDGIQRIQIM